LESEIVPYGTGDLGEPWTAGKVIADIMVTAKQTGLQIPPSWRSIAGKHAKAMLDDGIPGDVVTAACYMAILRGKPQLAQYIAGDLLLAASGQAMSRSEYEQKLALYAAGNGSSRRLLEEQKERLAQREVEIERRRNGEA
jgi:hypothetical protein